MQSVAKIVQHLLLENHGLKDEDLALKTASRCAYYGLGVSVASYSDLIQRMIDNNEILAVTYVLPNLPYRSLTFYLPGGTYLRVKPNQTDTLNLEPSHSKHSRGFVYAKTPSLT
jgi:hypothetical protein